ncbi:succinate-CoA ligase [Nadsonia fulvescens var. elongata DSM 6958]|uniref:Succinate-CoA ligase subunit beta n=1 Tax=Nadsonia fulvescens var. elongata DSM 6958 TaxID=857566 RepID=A0A1E3PMM0_9ASCO|nr:succinate-CoA ligase [Nadsonia fulvescens var. elongata DSM 6958]
MVIKAQALTGGRGKGTFDNGLKGGVKLISSPYEAKMYASQMVGHKLFTKQTGPAGKDVTAAYIVEREFVRREAYLAILMDRASQGPVIVASAQGGMDIEAVAHDTPDAIKSFKVDIHKGVTHELSLEIAQVLGFSSKAVPEAAVIIEKLYKVFQERDAVQIEINPLSETTQNKVMAMDAKLNFDDNADFRQTEVWSWRDLSQEDPQEVEAAKMNLNFIKLDGNIGCLVNGAGLAMATMDIIKLNGGTPANFLDCGGGATADAIKKAFELITSDPKVTAIFVNIFGGIVRCDNIAKGLIAVAQHMNINIPIVARLQGTNLEEAQRLISDSGLKIFSFGDLDEAAQKVCQFSKVVEMARDIDVNVSFELPL